MHNFLQTFPLQFWTRILGFLGKCFPSFLREFSAPSFQRESSLEVLGKNLLEVFGQNLSKFWGRIFRSFWGKSCGVIPAGKLRGSSPGLLGSPWIREHSLGSPPVGVAGCIRRLTILHPCGEDARTSRSQARRRKNFNALPLPAPHVWVSPPPPSVSLRVMAPSEFPR